MIAVYLAMLETDVDRDKFMKLYESYEKKLFAVAIKAAALVGILIIGILCYFLTRNNEKYIDVVDAESDQWNESQAEIEFNEIS